MSKNNVVNSKYPYNEPIPPTSENGLRYDGHVKCDALFETIKEDDILMRVGVITPSQYTKFMELYRQSVNNK